MSDKSIKVRSDSERMDWLNKSGRVVRMTDGWNAWNAFRRGTWIAKDIRQAIDMAMIADGVNESGGKND